MTTSNTKMVWHYTIGEFAAEIISAGILNPATAFIDPGEKPILWFSANQDWELTANKMAQDEETRELVYLTMEQTAEYGGGLFRFGLPESRAIRWPEVGKRAGMKSPIRGALMKTARQQGANPAEWYGVLQPVPVSETVIQGMLADGSRKWVDFDPLK